MVLRAVSLGKLNYGMIGQDSAQHILALELGKLTATEIGVPTRAR